MNKYKALIELHQKKINHFTNMYAFFAFNVPQFMDGLGKVGDVDIDTNLVKTKLTQTASGMYILKSRLNEYKKLTKQLENEKNEAISALN